MKDEKRDRRYKAKGVGANPRVCPEKKSEPLRCVATQRVIIMIKKQHLQNTTHHIQFVTLSEAESLLRSFTSFRMTADR